MEHTLLGYVKKILQNGDMELSNVTNPDMHNDFYSITLRPTRAVQVSALNLTGQDCEGNQNSSGDL